MILFQNGAFHFASAIMRLDTERASLDQVIIGHSMIYCYGKFLCFGPPLGNLSVRIVEYEDRQRQVLVHNPMISLVFEVATN